mgnify:CR=1 FL=1|tara:strand:- start:8 stop:862 length:855 start_codon:yes stop_codon:yes gene_type:complete
MKRKLYRFPDIEVTEEISEEIIPWTPDRSRDWGNNTKTHFYHIPKTGGRSIVAAFARLIYPDLTHKEAYRNANKMQRTLKQEFISCAMPDFGEWFFTYGHSTYKDINLEIRLIGTHDGEPIGSTGLNPKCFTFTSLRDPFDRLFSLYKEYMHELDKFELGEIDRISIQELTPESQHDIQTHKKMTLKDFARNSPDKITLEQLYYFSEKLDLDTAIKNIESLSAIVICENNKKGIEAISNHIGHKLEIGDRFSRGSNRPKDKDVQELLEQEYLFYNTILQKLTNE